MCRPCKRARAGANDPPRARGVGHATTSAPDPEPARHLGAQLAAARANGESFEYAFRDCARYVLACVADSRSRSQWSTAFSSTAWAWKAGWERQTFTKLTPALFDDHRSML
jgi:hypothetical protein